MLNRIVIFTLILCLSFPYQLAVVHATASSDNIESKIEAANDLQDKLSRLISADGIEFDLREAPTDPPPTDPVNPAPDPVDPTPDPGDPTPDPGDPTPDPVNPAPTPPSPPPASDNTQVQIVYACLLEDLQRQVSKLYEYARPAIVEYNGSNLSGQERPALKFSVVVNGDNLSGVRFRPFGRCYQNAATLPARDYRQMIYDLKYILDDNAVASILEELREIEQSRKEGQASDQFIMNNSSRTIEFRPKRAPVSRVGGVQHVLRELARRSSLEPVGPGLNGILDPSFSKLTQNTLKTPGYWILALQILLNASFDTREEMESDAARDNTSRLIDGGKPRDEAAEAEKAAKRKKLWGNIAKVGLAVGGGILAWKLIDSLNKDDDDDDEDNDRFDGPMMPPTPPPWMMQPPYGGMMPPGGYPGGFPGAYPPPYPPQPAYPPPAQMPPQMPPLPISQGPDYGRLLVDVKTKLEAIIRFQRDLISKYVRRTNVNMTDSDKDTFRRTVAQIDGLIREVNPLIQRMENTPIPGNPQDMGTIFDARQKVYRLIDEFKNNDREIKEFVSQINLIGSGMAGPMSAQSSPGVVAANATPWTDPKVRGLVDEYLAKNKLNSWGYPDTPGVIQNTPPSAMGKDRYQFLMDNPSIRSYVNSNNR